MKHRVAIAVLMLFVSACSGSNAPAAHSKTWKAWVRTFCSTQSEIRKVTDAATLFPDSRSFHVEHRLYPVMHARSSTEASEMRTRAIATLESVAATYRGAAARVRVLGSPASPSIRNGSQNARRNEHSLIVVASEIERLVPVARRLAVDDLKQFQTAFDALRAAAIGALAAHTIAPAPELERIMRQDSNCYWLGD